MPPSRLGPHVSAVTRTAVRAASTSRSAAFRTRATRRTCLPLTWASMASRAPSNVTHERAKRAAWKPITPSAAARRTSKSPRLRKVRLRTRRERARGRAATLAKQRLLEREPGEGIEQGPALALEGEPGEARSPECGLGGRGRSHRGRRVASARRGEARQQRGVLRIVEAAVHGGPLARPGTVRGRLCG